MGGREREREREGKRAREGEGTGSHRGGMSKLSPKPRSKNHRWFGFARELPVALPGGQFLSFYFPNRRSREPVLLKEARRGEVCRKKGGSFYRWGKSRDG